MLTAMNYDKVLEAVNTLSKDELKEVYSKIDREICDTIRSLGLDDETRKTLIMMSKKRVAYDMILINALKEDDK